MMAIDLSKSRWQAVIQARDEQETGKRHIVHHDNNHKKGDEGNAYHNSRWSSKDDAHGRECRVGRTGVARWHHCHNTEGTKKIGQQYEQWSPTEKECRSIWRCCFSRHVKGDFNTE